MLCQKIAGDNVKKMKVAAVFIGCAMAIHLIVCSVFPVDEKTNILLVPDWYIFVLLGLSALVAFLSSKLKMFNRWIRGVLNRRKSQKEYESMSDIERWKAEKEIERRKNLEQLVDRTDKVGHIESISISDTDIMEGHQFEYWCAKVLEKNGFVDMEVTKGSGDQGVDILAKKDGIKYAIQCKCYSHDLGNTPIQEVESGRRFYDCHIGVVMTNRHFTRGAKELAEKTGTLLWDRDYIESTLLKSIKAQ